MNTSILIFIFATTSIGLSRAPCPFRSSAEQLSKTMDEMPFMNMLRGLPDLGQFLSSMTSPFFDDNDTERPSRPSRIPRSPSRIPRSPSRIPRSPSRTASKLNTAPRSKSFSSSPNDAKVPELKIGTTAKIDDQGNVTVDEKPLYKQHPELKLAKSGKITIRNGTVTINGVPILRIPSNLGNNKAFNSELFRGARWIKIEVLRNNEVKFTDNRRNSISQRL